MDASDRSMEVGVRLSMAISRLTIEYSETGKATERYVHVRNLLEESRALDVS